MQPEAKLVKKIRKYLEEEGAVVFKIHGGDNPFQEVGIPDLLCCLKGIFIAIEVKMPGEQPSAAQASTLRRIARAGGYAFTAHSVGEVEEALKGVL